MIKNTAILLILLSILLVNCTKGINDSNNTNDDSTTKWSSIQSFDGMTWNITLNNNGDFYVCLKHPSTPADSVPSGGTLDYYLYDNDFIEFYATFLYPNNKYEAEFAQAHCSNANDTMTWAFGSIFAGSNSTLMGTWTYSTKSSDALDTFSVNIDTITFQNNNYCKCKGRPFDLEDTDSISFTDNGNSFTLQYSDFVKEYQYTIKNGKLYNYHNDTKIIFLKQ